MNKNRTFDFTDLDDIAVDLRRAVKLITLFIEFCEEGYLPDGTTRTEAAIKAVTFLKRLDQHEEMLFSSLDILDRNVATLQEMFEYAQSKAVTA